MSVYQSWISVCGVEWEDHWSAHTLAKQSGFTNHIPACETRSLELQKVPVLWWHPNYWHKASRRGGFNVVVLHHDHFYLMREPAIAGAFYLARRYRKEISKYGKPIFRLHVGVSEDVPAIYKASKRTVDKEKIWLGFIGGGGSRWRLPDGRRVGRKGQEDLVEICKLLDPAKFAVTLIGLHWGWLHEQLLALGWEVFRPRYSKRGLQYRYLRDVDVYLCLSHIEAGPLPLLESMSVGIWPVCRDVGIVPEVITEGETGKIIGYDVEAIASYISGIRRDFLEAKKEKVKQAASEWTWARFREELRNGLEWFSARYDCNASI